MTRPETVLAAVRKALTSEARIDLPHHPLRLSWHGGDLTIEGEVADVAAKKLALERSAAVSGVTAIVDRLRVRPAQVMGDDDIRDHVRDALLQEPGLAACALVARDKGEDIDVRLPDPAHGSITVAVHDGVVTLDGEVPGLAQKRIAGVLAWWVPGSRDVINGLEVSPAEADNAGEIVDAVRLVLEKDPFVNASEIRVSARRAAVALDGLVTTSVEREMAEFDAWYVFGVDRVINRIKVRA